MKCSKRIFPVVQHFQSTNYIFKVNSMDFRSPQVSNGLVLFHNADNVDLSVSTDYEFFRSNPIVVNFVTSAVPPTVPMYH